MGMNVFELFGKIDVNDTEAKSKIDNIVKKAKAADINMSKSFDKVGNAFNRGMDNIISKVGSLDGHMIKGLNKTSAGLQSVGGKLTSSITKPATVAATALASITMVKGFGRLMGIDDARAKLKALRFDTKQVDEIMNNALESVKGTSFGMGEAATTAANAVAAGIEPGKELTKYLKMTGDAAAIAGVDLAEMGSIVNKVQTGGKAMTENLEQLSDRGLPVYQWLAKEAGVAADEVKEMASAGEISSEMFFKAIEKNVGGAAAIIGENSFRASLANIGSSLGRIGANFLDAGGKGGGFFSQLKPLLTEFRESLEVVEKKAADVGVAFGKAFGDIIKKSREALNELNKLPEAAKESIAKFAGIGAAAAVFAGPIITAVGKVTGIISTVGGAISGMMGAITSGIAALAPLAPLAVVPFEFMTGALTGMIPVVGETMGAVVSVIGGALTKISALALAVISPAAIVGLILVAMGAANMAFGGQLDEMITKVMEKGPKIIEGLTQGIQSALPNLMAQGADVLAAIGQGIATNLPAVLGMATTIITGLVNGVTQALPKLIPVSLNIITSLITGIITNLPKLIIAGLNLIQGLVTGIINNLPKIVQSASKIIDTFGNSITKSGPVIIDKGIKILTSLIDGIIQAIPKLLPVALKAITTIVSGIITNLPKIIEGGIKILTSLINGIVKVLPQLIPTALKMIVQLQVALISNFPKIGAAGIKLVGALINGIISVIGTLVTTAGKMVKSIWDTMVNTNWIDVGKNIISGMANGLANAGHMLWDAVKGVLGSFKDNVLGFFGIHSPSRWGRDEVGRFIPQGIAVGIEKDGDTIQDSMDEVANALTFEPDLDSNLAYSVDGGSFTSSKQLELQNNQDALNAEMIELLTIIANKDTDVTLDGVSLVEGTKERMSRALSNMNNANNRSNGIVQTY